VVHFVASVGAIEVSTSKRWRASVDFTDAGKRVLPNSVGVSDRGR
jgi:hypothetical protein